MHKSIVITIILAGSQPMLAQSTITPILLPPDSPQLHLVTRTPPAYPPIARAAHVSGIVSVRMGIQPDGHIVSMRVLDGPLMLRAAAGDSLRGWMYAPVLVDGKAVAVLTTITVPFDLNAPSSQYAQSSSSATTQDGKLMDRFNSLEAACESSLAAAPSAPSRQVELCQKGADVADQYSQDGYSQRRRAFSDLSTALRHNGQSTEALTAADKAVMAVREGLQDGAAASGAYSVRAEAEVKLGKLAEASEDLTLAEDNERSEIAFAQPTSRALGSAPGNSFEKNSEKMNQSYATSNFVPVLKALLTYHAQLLQALGKQSEAGAKTAEAGKL